MAEDELPVRADPDPVHEGRPPSRLRSVSWISGHSSHPQTVHQSSR